ncbi:MAG: hypothetical protein ASARMPRED_007874 [Alectoria sarmentosa]|nr:MAG: hypothetical protein ASARMPRED_007874 [Alectoria sarmentosa]
MSATLPQLELLRPKLALAIGHLEVGLADDEVKATYPGALDEPCIHHQAFILYKVANEQQALSIVGGCPPIDVTVNELILKKDVGGNWPEEDENLEIENLTTDEEEDEAKTRVAGEESVDGNEQEGQNGYEVELREGHKMEPMSVEGENNGHADAVMEG